MVSIDERVREETLRFEAALPGLMDEYAGKWVVFKDGGVISTHDTEEIAYIDGLKRFGREGGHIVALVSPMTIVPISAAAMFGLA